MSAAPNISTGHPFMNRDVVMNLSNGMSTTLKMMANIDAQFGKPFVDASWSSPKEISVFLVLNTPTYKGKLQFHFDMLVAKKIIENMIGSEVDQNSPEILDGVGEISNIFYGAAKTKLKDLGVDLNMSIPQPCWTKDLPESVGQKMAMVIPFKVENKDCYVEIILY